MSEIYHQIKKKSTSTPVKFEPRHFKYNAGSISFVPTWTYKYVQKYPIIEADFGLIDLEKRSDVQLLNFSIAKWKALIEFMQATGSFIGDGGTRSCALCHKYLRAKNVTNGCLGCPIRNKTGEQHCGGTPYSMYAMFRHNRFVTQGDTIKYAQKMMDFLVSLRDEQLKVKGAKHSWIIEDDIPSLSMKYATEFLNEKPEPRHVLHFFDLVEKANAAGADKGKTTIQCNICLHKFAVEYHRLGSGLQLHVYDKKTAKTYRFVLPANITKDTAIGID